MTPTGWIILIGLLALIAAGTAWALFHAPMRRPEGSSAARDQMIAQERVVGNRPRHPDDVAWDGVERTPLPTQDGGVA